jgi:non-ribosomal peptide synthetase component F
MHRTGRTNNCLHELLEIQAKATPKKIALQFEDSVFITYAELNSLADRAAAALRGLGIRRGDFIPISIHKSPELVIAILAILKSGAAYVPMDPAHPVARRQEIIDQVSAKVVIADQSQTGSLSGPNTVVVTVTSLLNNATLQRKEAQPSTAATIDSLALVIFTSGTTYVFVILCEHTGF